MFAAPSDESPLPPLLGKPRALALAAGVFALATLLVFGDLLFAGGDYVLSRRGTDLSSVFVGWCEFTVRELAVEHNLPLWNPHLFSGAPCLGGFQWALLYPPTWLLLVMPIPQAVNWGIALHVFLAGLFTYVWMARRGLHPAAAILAGLIFMFGGGYFMHITAGHLPNLRTMVWAPLIFLAIDDITSTRSFRGAWFGAFAVTMQILAGHPQYTYYNALIAAPYALLGIVRAPSRSRAILGLALMGVGAVGMSAAQLFTGLQAASESMRTQLPMSVAGTFPFPPENLLTLILPGIFGQTNGGVYWGRWLLWENSLFIGIAALSLAVFGAIRGERRLGGRVLAVFCVICLIIAMGKYTPLYSLLYQFVPGMNSFRGISKVAFMSALFLSALAGIGFDRLLRGPRPSAATWIILVAVAMLFLSAGLFILSSAKAGPAGVWGHVISHVDLLSGEYRIRMSDKDLFDTSVESASRALLWGALAAGLCSVAWLLTRKWPRLVYGIALLATIELLTFGWINRPTFDVSVITANEARMRNFLQHALPEDARVISGDPSVVMGAGGSDGWGNDPMVLRRYAQFIATGQHVSAEELLRLEYPFFAPDAIMPFWRMARIDAAFVPMDGKSVPLRTHGPRLARAQLIEKTRLIEDPQAMLSTIADPTFDPQREVLLERPIANFPAPSQGTFADPAGVVSLNDRSTDEIEVTAEVNRPCILLISDTYSAGWRVSPLGGNSPQRYEVIPADHTFRAVALAPGSHHFLLEYCPPAWIVGKWVTCGSVILWALAALKLFGKPKPRPQMSDIQ